VVVVVVVVAAAAAAVFPYSADYYHYGAFFLFQHFVSTTPNRSVKSQTIAIRSIPETLKRQWKKRSSISHD
jgi:hypothetical protein